MSKEVTVSELALLVAELRVRFRELELRIESLERDNKIATQLSQEIVKVLDNLVPT